MTPPWDGVWPHSVEAEEALLGSLLIDPETLSHVQPFLYATDFYIVKNRWVYKACLSLRERGEGIDFVTVCAELERRSQLEEAGGPAFVSHLINVTPMALNAISYGRVVEHLALQRKLMEEGESLWTKGFDADYDHYALIDEKIASLGMARRNGHQREVATWGDLERMIAPMRWEWKNWLPVGMLVILAAMSGEGKSAVMVRLAGCFTRSDDLPDGSPYAGEIGKILWIETEYAEALNLSRAKPWGLPLDSMLTPFDDPFREANLDNHNHRAAVLAVARRPDVRAIFVDSLSGSTRRDEKSGEMLELGLWLAALARDTAKPVLVSHHLRKRSLFDGDDIDLERVRGSTTIVQPARVVWALDAPDVTHREIKRLHVIKSNLGRFPDPIGLTIDDAGVTFCAAPEAPREETQSERLADLLLDLLTNGPVTAEKIQREVEQAGLSWHGAKRVKEKLGIVSVKPGGIWHWSLPANE